MSEPLCRDCSDLQIAVKATRMIGKTPVCDKHMRQRLGMPATEADLKLNATKQEGTSMAKRIDEETRAEILKDHADGMNVEQIRIKHNVAWITAKTIIGGGGRKFAGGRPGGKKTADPSREGSVTLVASAELCDGIWATLPLAKKAALLNKLAEVN